MDLKWWKVKNLWLLAGAAGALPYHIFCGESVGIGQGLIGMVLPVLILGWLYLIKKMGAGDIKMFCVIGLYMGGEKVLIFMLASMLGGAVYYLFLSVSARSFTAVLGRRIHVAVCAFFAAVCQAFGIIG